MGNGRARGWGRRVWGVGSRRGQGPQAGTEAVGGSRRGQRSSIRTYYQSATRMLSEYAITSTYTIDKLHTRFDAAFTVCFKMQLVRRVASSPCSPRDFHSLRCLEPQHQPRSVLVLFVGPRATCSSPCGLAAVVTCNRRLRPKTVAMTTIPGPGRHVASVRGPMTSSSRTSEAEVARSPSTGRTA